MSQLNQVLFHENSRVGADMNAWNSTIGGQGLNNALENPAAIIPIIVMCRRSVISRPPRRPA